MPLLFAQDTPPPAQPVEVHVSAPPIDFGAIGHSIVDAITQALPDLIGGIGAAAGSNLHSATGNLWSGLWTSGANVFTRTDPAQTINFGPIPGYTAEASLAAYGIILLGVVLLGLRTMLSSFAPCTATRRASWCTALKRTDYTHRVVWRRVYGAIPSGLDVDHVCRITLCQRPDHLQLLTKPDNTRRRHRRDQ